MIFIVWKINLIPKLNGYTKIEVRNFKDFNADNFRTDLRGCGKLGKLILGCSRQACSSKRKDGEKQTECALTSAIKLQIRERDRLKRLAINFNSEDYWNAYKISTNKTTDVLRKAKTNYYKRQFKKIRDDPKKPWETVNKILNR